MLVRVKRQMKILELAGKVEFWELCNPRPRGEWSRLVIVVDTSIWIDYLRGVASGRIEKLRTLMKRSRIAHR